MKPVVRWVDGEPRVWVPIDGQKDAMRRQVFVGDKLQTHDTGGRVLTYIAIPGAVGFALSVINASPGIPCEVEMPQRLRRDIYACTCGHSEAMHLDFDTGVMGPCTKCNCTSYQEESA